MTTTFKEDLEYVVSGTGHSRYRDLTDPFHPAYDVSWVGVVTREAARLRQEEAKTEEEWAKAYPTGVEQARNALGAIGRAAVAAVTGQTLAVPKSEQDRRLAICHACPLYDAAQARCTVCGCYADFKVKLATESCPEGKW